MVALFQLGRLANEPPHSTLPAQAKQGLDMTIRFIPATHDWEAGAYVEAFVGQRVEIHPGTDTWMRGDRYGEIVKLGTSWVHVRFDRSGRTLQVAAPILRALTQLPNALYLAGGD